jgi:hypothetical protein
MDEHYSTLNLNTKKIFRRTMGKEIDHPLMENRTGITEDKKSNHI